MPNLKSNEAILKQKSTLFKTSFKKLLVIVNQDIFYVMSTDNVSAIEIINRKDHVLISIPQDQRADIVHFMQAFINCTLSNFFTLQVDQSSM